MTNFPVQVNKQLGDVPLNDIQLEGKMLFTLKTPGLGSALYVDSVIVMATSPTNAPVKFNFGTALNGSFVAGQYEGPSAFIGANTSIQIPVKKIFKYGESLFIQKSTDESVGIISFIANSYKISEDINFAAKNVIYCLGDSVANLDGYISRVGGHMFNVAKLSVNTIGYNSRMIADSMSGKSSTDLVNSLKNGLKVVRQADVILFMHGINDAYQNTTDANWRLNLEYMINWRNLNYPKSKLVLVGATHLSNTESTQIERLAQLRAIESTYADANNNIYYKSMADVVLPNYNPNSTYFTDGIHPTQASHDLYGAALGAFLKTIV
jgi:lysophospholipase L1-like esterase